MITLAETPKLVNFTNHVYGPCGDGKTDGDRSPPAPLASHALSVCSALICAYFISVPCLYFADIGIYPA